MLQGDNEAQSISIVKNKVYREKDVEKLISFLYLLETAIELKFNMFMVSFSLSVTNALL